MGKKEKNVKIRKKCRNDKKTKGEESSKRKVGRKTLKCDGRRRKNQNEMRGK